MRPGVRKPILILRQNTGLTAKRISPQLSSSEEADKLADPVLSCGPRTLAEDSSAWMRVQVNSPSSDCRSSEAKEMAGIGRRLRGQGGRGGASGYLIYVCSNNPRLSSPASSWDFPRCALLEGKKGGTGGRVSVSLQSGPKSNPFPFLPVLCCAACWVRVGGWGNARAPR